MLGLAGRAALPLLLGITLSGSAVSSPRGQPEVSLTFQGLGPVLTGPEVGLPAGQGMWQPSAAVLPDGRIRLYYTTPVPGGVRTGPSGTFSAISTDGVHFTPEAGQRWNGGNVFIERLPDGRWRLYYPHSTPAPPGSPPTPPDGIASAIGTDGLTFTAEPGLRLANPQPDALVLHCCAIIGLADGRYRMYVSTEANFPPGAPPSQTYSAVSSDLTNWTLEPGVRVTGQWAPAALANPDGSLMLVSVDRCCFGGRIQTASSPDGLTFATPSGTNLSGNDPAFVMLPNGRLLMYYDTGDPSTINAAVATRVTAPAVSYPSPAATAITATSARVSAIVDPNGAATTYAFEYGRSTGYGDGTGVAPVPGTSGQLTVSATLTGLSPATTYHFRVDAYNSVGSTNGADQTFKTGACPLGAQRDRGWEVALGHAVTRTGALRALRRARTLRRSGALVERDGCTDYEAALTGLRSKGSAAKTLKRAKRRGFRRATLERT